VPDSLTLQEGDYTVQVSEDSVVKLSQRSERHITSVNVSPERVSVQAIPYSRIGRRMAAAPLLAATWAGDGYANVDLDCGAQRFNGTRSLRWLRSGLYRAGFSKSQVDSVFRQMRKSGPQQYAPSYRF